MTATADVQTLEPVDESLTGSRRPASPLAARARGGGLLRRLPTARWGSRERLTRANAASGRYRDLLIAAVVFGWITTVLMLDPGAGIWFQRLLGVLTWALLLLLSGGESAHVRAQIAVVVVVATVVEYTFSPLLEVYVYRLDNVPAFVPPGHGLVYLCALAIGRSALLRRQAKAWVTAAVVAGGAYALWGLVGPGRVDVLGAFWYLCLLGFLRWGRSRLLYVGALAVVTYLEVLGTALGVWEWQPYDPTGTVAIGNPPSGAAGGYGWFDLAALLAAPAVVTVAARLRTRLWR